MLNDEALLANFVEESQQHLQDIEPDLLELEKGGDNVDKEVVNRIFRSVHSIKGASGFFGLKNIGELSHAMENLMSLVREGKKSVTSELTDNLLEGLDTLRAMIDDVAASEEIDIKVIVEKIEKMLTQKPDQKEKVIVKEKSESGEGKLERTFELDEETINSLLSKGQYLYSVTISIHVDLRDKGKTPYDYINNMESFGRFIDTYLDIYSITGLDDCLDNDIAFIFLFATVLEPDLVIAGLEVPKEQIKAIDLEFYRKIIEEKGSDDKKVKLSILEEETKKTRSKGVEEVENEKKDDKKEKEDVSLKPKENIHKIQAEEKLRVGVNLLNELVNLAGELVLGRNQLMQITSDFLQQEPQINSVIQNVSRITTEMQEKIMQLRMQPVSVVFQKFNRVVRDIARNLKKDIVLETSGEDVELDKSIIESLSDPLTHLIRNSADHGIELPEEREKSGKPRQGKIKLNAFHEGGQVHLEVIDNGKGIDAGKIGEKAVEKKLISEEELETLSEKELVRFIFNPGFSTAKKVSSVSGRGVGMDVVLTNIEHLGGNVDIETTLGEGTKISLILPLTLAIVSGLIVKVNKQSFVIPEVNVDEIVRIKFEEINKKTDIVQNTRVLRLRDLLLPLISLKSILWGRSNIDIDINKDEALRILIIKFGSFKFGLIVESIENIEEIVVKPLPRYLKKLKSFSGSTILGNGSVALILDVAGLLDLSSIKEFDEKYTQKEDTEKELISEHDLQTLLLFDNNSEETFAIPLELISRIEKVDSSKIEKIKKRQFLQYQGQNLQMIFLEDHLPISVPKRKESDNLGVLIPKQMKHPFGIVINRVIDTVRTAVNLDTETEMSPGLFGTAIINDKITLLPDMYKLFEMAAPEWQTDEEMDVKRKKRKRKILLVDDVAFFRMVESEYLTSAGYKVITAENGRKALDLLDKEKVDAVVLDIIMPVMDGWEVIKEIRKNEKLKNLPVLAVTSLGDEENAVKGIREGFDDWEVKLNKTRLLEKLKKILTSKEEKVS